MDEEWDREWEPDRSVANQCSTLQSDRSYTPPVIQVDSFRVDADFLQAIINVRLAGFGKLIGNKYIIHNTVELCECY